MRSRSSSVSMRLRHVRKQSGAVTFGRPSFEKDAHTNPGPSASTSSPLRILARTRPVDGVDPEERPAMQTA